MKEWFQGLRKTGLNGAGPHLALKDQDLHRLRRIVRAWSPTLQLDSSLDRCLSIDPLRNTVVVDLPVLYSTIREGGDRWVQQHVALVTCLVQDLMELLSRYRGSDRQQQSDLQLQVRGDLEVRRELHRYLHVEQTWPWLPTSALPHLDSWAIGAMVTGLADTIVGWMLRCWQPELSTAPAMAYLHTDSDAIKKDPLAHALVRAGLLLAAGQLFGPKVPSLEKTGTQRPAEWMESLLSFNNGDCKRDAQQEFRKAWPLTWRLAALHLFLELQSPGAANTASPLATYSEPIKKLVEQMYELAGSKVSRERQRQACAQLQQAGGTGSLDPDVTIMLVRERRIREAAGGAWCLTDKGATFLARINSIHRQAIKRIEQHDQPVEKTLEEDDIKELCERGFLEEPKGLDRLLPTDEALRDAGIRKDDTELAAAKKRLLGRSKTQTKLSPVIERLLLSRGEIEVGSNGRWQRSGSRKT